MALPTRKVTCQLYDQQGNPAAKAKIQFRLTGTELIDGVVAPELFEQEADDTGLAIFEVVPNVLGVNGTQYQVRAWNPDTGKKFLDGFCTVPDQDVGLHQILLTDPPPTIDSAQQAVIAAQAAALEAANSAIAAYDSETTVAASVAAALASEIASLASQEAAAISATESASSASDALASELAAKLSETNANTSEGASLASEQAAAASAVDSAASALAALGSEQAAAASATDANAAVPVWAALSPPAPINGAIWIDSNSGREFKWYEDGSSGQWVETGAVVQMGYETAAVIEVAAASAMNSKLVAEASAAEATASKDTAVSSAAASLDSENKAHLWAAAPRGTVVADGEYSAKHWALEAQQAAEGALVYRGLFSAAAGVYPANPSLGDYYRISDGGVINGVSYATGDSIIYNGSSWDKTESSNAVVSVAGRVGSVVLSKADVGLDNVDNTSDINKPVSTAQATALATKQDTLANGTNIKTLNGESVLGAGNIEILGGPTVSDTEPPTPKNGQEWVDGVTGIKYTWVDDGSSAQWVELGPGGTPAATSVFLRDRANHTGTQDATTVLVGSETVKEYIDSRPAGHLFQQDMWNGARLDIPLGFIPEDGQVIYDATYPEACAAIRSGKQYAITEAAWQADPLKRNCWSLGDGTTWVRAPDNNGVQAGSIGKLYKAGDGGTLGGTVVGDEFKSHTHTSSGGVLTLNLAGGTSGFGLATNATQTSSSTGGGETRPKTSYQCYIVRVSTGVSTNGTTDLEALAQDVTGAIAEINPLKARQKALGDGQTRQNVTASRLPGVTYVNTTGRPILLSVRATTTASGGAVRLNVAGGAVIRTETQAVGAEVSASAIILAGEEYLYALGNSSSPSVYEVRS